MKYLHKLTGILLCVLLFAVPIRVLAEDDPYEEQETETVTVQTTTAPQTTAASPEETAASAEPTRATSAPKAVDPPLVKITRGDLSASPKAGESFTATVVFHNYSGETALRSGLASFEPSEGIVLSENSASKVVPVIETSGVRNVQIRLRVAKDCASANQSVTVTYTYSYKTPDGTVQAETTEKLLFTVVPASSAESTSSASSATPNIIVTDYNYGGRITAGDTFTLRLQFQNTSRKLSAENIVMSVETGAGLSITSASNTYYFSSLAAGKTQTQSIPMRVAVNADPEGATIDISFRYEYVDGGTRSDASASEKLSVPIYIPDRFTVSAPDMELVGMQNEELSLSLPYINKSRVEVNNVSAELLFDEQSVFCEQPRVNLGNFEAGKSGTIDFYFTPLEAGSGSVSVQVTYEDELMQEKKLEIRVPFSADEGYVDPGMEEPMDFPDEEPSSLAWLRWAIPAAVLVVVIAAVVLIVRRRKKKKAAEPSIDFDWGDAQEVKTHEHT